MSRFAASLPPSYFAGQYASDPDPWRLATSAYEHAKYAATLAALPAQRYASGMEVGCSIGVHTEALAGRCDALIGGDVADMALDQARRRCASHPHVRFLEARVPGAWPEGAFDLILLSEVVYFLDEGDVRRLAERVRQSLQPGGTVALVHWTGETHYPLSGDAAAELFMAAGRGWLRPIHRSATDAYRLDVLIAASDAGQET